MQLIQSFLIIMSFVCLQVRSPARVMDIQYADAVARNQAKKEYDAKVRDMQLHKQYRAVR